uniref:Uncharacterized protein n=1 Tax=Aegilops tauschii subsp. strangulata TaxID=200361 RepID=A0A453LXF9_AEGTS
MMNQSPARTNKTAGQRGRRGRLEIALWHDPSFRRHPLVDTAHLARRPHHVRHPPLHQTERHLQTTQESTSSSLPGLCKVDCMEKKSQIGNGQEGTGIC